MPRRLARLRGTLEQLLADPTLTDDEGAWVEATLTDAVRPDRPMEHLCRRFPHALLLAFEPEGAVTPSAPAGHPAGRPDHEIVLDFVAEMRGCRRAWRSRPWSSWPATPAATTPTSTTAG
ncbi:MAG: exonuclease SbcCD subunit D C-terminal domain-containing protein [Nocardioides sp.]